MKRYIILLFLLLMFGCVNNSSKQNIKQYKFYVSTKSGTGWDAGFSYIKCDSVHMISSKEAIVWIDGSKNKIITDRILIQTN